MSSNIEVDRPDRAPRVCSNCKVKKKACDKAIPSCSYCVHRALLCRYPSTTPVPITKEYNDAAEDTPSYREFILPLETRTTEVVQYGDIPQSSSSSMPSSGKLADIIWESDQSASSSTGNPTKRLAIDGLIHDQVQSIIRATGQFIDEVTVRYFRGVHEWIPIISRTNFQHRLVNFSAQPRADFSLLLLSMCLITYHPSYVEAECISLETVYFVTKMLFTNVQEAYPSSPNLIQAGILISIHEYARSKLEAAFDTIVNCANMAYAIGLDKLRSSRHREGDDSRLGHGKNDNIWWGIVIYERVIICETPANKPLTTRLLPGLEALPLESDILDQLDVTRSRVITRAPFSNFESSEPGSYGLQAQTAALLEQVLRLRTLTDAKSQLAEVAAIDESLMALLQNLLDLSDKAQERYCGPIAISIRALYLLHSYKFDGNSSGLQSWSSKSHAALDTVSKMVIDIARYHNTQRPNRSDIKLVPPTTSFIIKAALRHLDTESAGNGVGSKDIEILGRFLENIYHAWNV